MPSKTGYNYQEPNWVRDFLVASANKKLSSADRGTNNQMKQQVQFSPQEMASNIRTEIDPSNLMALDSALQSATDPDILKILQDEKSNVMKLVEEAARIKSESAASKQQEKSWTDQIGSFLQSIFTKGN